MLYLIIPCAPMFGNLFDFIIVASTSTGTVVVLAFQSRGAESNCQPSDRNF